MVTTKSETKFIERLEQSTSLLGHLLASDENDTDDEQEAVGPRIDTPNIDPTTKSESPLDHTGPIPPEYQRDPYAVEVFPLPTEDAPDASSKPRLQIQERLIWASAIVVSWSITVVAILKVLGVL